MIDAADDKSFLARTTLLLVEDDPDARAHLAAALARRVGRVLTAPGGAQGLEAFRAERPHLVVTDIQMPGLDGLGMAESIRALDPKVPIIFTTAFEQTDYMARAIDLGISHYVLKPIQMDRLDACLLKCAHGLRAERELARRQEVELELAQLRHHEAVAFLLGGIAHDCNNLMQGILTSVAMANTTLGPEHPVHGLLDVAEQGLLEARQLGLRLRLLSNPWREPDRRGPIGELVRTAVLETVAGSATLVEFTFHAGDLPVCHNEARLAQAVAALARNAVDAMPGGGTLQVGCEVVERAGHKDHPAGLYLHLVLRDSGPGIDPAVLPMIFEPYFTTKARTSQRGTGLGLAVCEAIVRAHGGWIEAESRPGEGAAFHIYLPEASE